MPTAQLLDCTLRTPPPLWHSCADSPANSRRRRRQGPTADTMLSCWPWHLAGRQLQQLPSAAAAQQAAAQQAAAGHHGSALSLSSQLLLSALTMWCLRTPRQELTTTLFLQLCCGDFEVLLLHHHTHTPASPEPPSNCAALLTSRDRATVLLPCSGVSSPAAAPGRPRP